MEFLGIKRDIRKVAELGIGAVALGTLILAGCGGGGGSSSTPPAVATTSTQITAFKGMFTNAVVTVYDAVGAIISTGNIASGVASVTYPSTANYPLVVSVSGVYLNDVTNLPESTTVPLLGFVASSAVAVAASGVPVTAITNLAVAQIQQTAGPLTVPHASTPITVSNVTTALTNAGTQFGIPATAIPSFDANGLAKDGNTVALAGLAQALNSQNPGINLSTALNNLAASYANPASSVSAVTTILPKLNAGITYIQTYNASPQLPSTAVTAVQTAVQNLIITPPPAIVPIAVVSSSAATQIATSTTLLSSLHTDFILQASGVQADLNNILSPFQEAQNFELFLATGMSLASNGTAASTSRAYVNGYPCVLMNLSGQAGATSTTGTVVCQWSGNYAGVSPTIHQLTISGPNNTSAGVYTLTPIGHYTWSDTLVPTASLSISGASSVSATGVTPATGTVDGTAAGVTLNGSILPGEGITSTHTLTNITNLVVTESQNAAATANTFGITGAVAQMNGSATIDSVTLAKGTQLVQVASTGSTLSATVVAQATTPNYSFNGTLSLPTYAQQKNSSTWNPSTITFTGSVSSAALGTFLNTGTSGGLTVNSNWANYDPTQAQSATNFPTESGSFTGNIINGTSTYGVNLTFASGTTGTTYSTITSSATVTDSSNNAVTLSETGTTSGLATTAATLGTNNSGTVSYANSAANPPVTSTQVGTISGGVITFTDLSTLSLK